MLSITIFTLGLLSFTDSVSAISCIKPNSLNWCEPCINSDQCGNGSYCSPSKRLCVMGEDHFCGAAKSVNCRPQCFDTDDQNSCSCCPGYPYTWQHATCSDKQILQPTAEDVKTSTGAVILNMQKYGKHDIWSAEKTKTQPTAVKQ